MKASILQLPEGMEVYVDMDGVLADFFAEYAKLAGITSGNYRDIPPAKADPTLDKMVGTDFFARLPKFPSADKLLDIVVNAAGSYNICSSPLRGDHENSAKNKKVWISKHLKVQPKNIFIVANKSKYAKNADGMPNVLIDDRGKNITEWEAAGGIGIKYQADEDSLKKVLDGLKRARRVGQGEEQHEPQQLISRDRGGTNAIATSTDEGWKDIAAAGALGTALAFGSGAADAGQNPVHKTTAVQHVQKINPEQAEATLKQVAVKSGLKGTELAQFMAQCSHETLNFTKLKEIGGSLDFKKYDPKHAPQKAKTLGNTKVGDGARYAGRGFIQLTGRENYRKAGEALGLPLEQHPEMVEKPLIAAKVAVWYWKNRVQSRVDNFNDTAQVTKFINPSLRGLDNRQSQFKDYKTQLAAR